jgi:hypothetical protein
VPFCTLLTGPLYIVTGIPGLMESRKTAQLAEKHLQTLKRNQTDTTSETEPLLIKLSQEEEIAQIARATFRKHTAELGTVNWGLLLGIGVTQIALGVTALLGAETASLLGYSAALVGQVALVTLQVLVAGTGAIYLARGGLMVYRALTNLELAKSLRQEIEDTFKNLSEDPTDDVKNLIKFFEMNSATKEVDGKNVDIYTGTSIEKIKGITSKEALVEYLQKLDKGLYSEILKQETALYIGMAMILGGVLTLIAAGFSSGISVPIISAISSAAFLCVEGIFLRYDSSDSMNKYTESKYQKPDWLRANDGLSSEIPRSPSALEVEAPCYPINI